MLPGRERPLTFTLEPARCYDLRRAAPAAPVHLLDLERLSPASGAARGPGPRPSVPAR
ncbi:hypothetical protein IHE61_22540 [Streptomyces sp. GKU 257-1]|nr:hypothetical protein [Streptomyces sp. GKU 257-1]